MYVLQRDINNMSDRKYKTELQVADRQTAMAIFNCLIIFFFFSIKYDCVINANAKLDGKQNVQKFRARLEFCKSVLASQIETKKFSDLSYFYKI